MAPWFLALLAASGPWLASSTEDAALRRQGALSAPVVTVKNGSYSGVHSPEYHQDFFLGMPYAQKPPRFTVSQPLDSSWIGTHDATSYPPHCIGYGDDDVGYAMSEDCLYLNVIRPSGIDETADLPVVVWIHGGSLVDANMLPLYMGGSADRRYNLSFIVRNSVDLGTPIVAVSLNYRLSAFGFMVGKEALDAGATNIGFRDQRLALHWVRENIVHFGGSPKKVTIFGESSGAESMTAHVIAYDGRDDGLFRSVMGDSGFGGIVARYPGGFNATEAMQESYDAFVKNTSCAPTVNTAASLDCLRNLPFDEIDGAINNTDSGPWAPVLDGDFITGWPSAQLRDGKFVKVPVLIGSNTDEGTAFGVAGINTDEEFAAIIAANIAPGVEFTTGKTAAQLTAEVENFYPNIQAAGEPSLKKWPVIMPGDAVARSKGLQWRRSGAFFGDSAMHMLRRRASIAWSDYGLPSYSYRFDVVVTSLPGYVGATHFQEVAFVFDNVRGDGYAVNPFANASAAYLALAKTMSNAWINFVVGGDPNGGGLGLPGGATWPVYNTSVGGGVGQNIVFSDHGSFVEMDCWRAEAIDWLIKNSQAVLGI